MKSLVAIGLSVAVCLVACSSESQNTPTPEPTEVTELPPPTITSISTIHDAGGVEVWWEYQPDIDVTIEVQRSSSPAGPWVLFGTRETAIEPWPVGRSGIGFCLTIWFRAFAVKGDLRSEPSEVKSGYTGEPFPVPGSSGCEMGTPGRK